MRCNQSPEQSYQQALKNSHKQQIQRHIDDMNRMGKQEWWQHIQQFKRFWGEDRFNRIISDMKAVLNDNENS